MTYSKAMFRLANDRTWHEPVEFENNLVIFADDGLYPDGVASATGLFSDLMVKYAWSSDPDETFLTSAGLILTYTRWDGRTFDPGGVNHHVLHVDCFPEINPTVGELVFVEQRFSGAFSPLYDELIRDDNRDVFVRAIADLRAVTKTYEALAWHRLGWDLSGETPVTSYISPEAAHCVITLAKNNVDFDFAAQSVVAGANTPDLLMDVIEHDIDSELVRRLV